MRNIDHILELLQLKWASIGIMVLLVIVACLSVFYFKWGLWPKLGLVTVSLAGVVCLLASMPRDYNLILLSGEEDNTAEGGFNYLENHLSDGQLARLLSPEEKNPYLTSNNVRFYLALIAARRGLHITNAAEVDRPRFFAANSYNGFANGLNFPLSYQEFFQKYQETAHKEAK
jgi:hypothetical protein